MKATLLKEFTLDGISLEDFFNYFWQDNEFSYDFLVKQLNDINVSIDDWEDLKSDVPNLTCKRRQIISFHPSKISFPGLPSHAESIKSQTIYITNGQNYTTNTDNQRIVIKEINCFKGIPYSDYFSVNIEWIVLNSVNNISKTNNCLVSVYVDFTFHKSTWLQGTIESNTKAELENVYNLWIQTAEKYIKENHIAKPLIIQQQQMSPSQTNNITLEASSTTSFIHESTSNEDIMTNSIDIESSSTFNLSHRHTSSTRRPTATNNNITTISTSANNNNNLHKTLTTSLDYFSVYSTTGKDDENSDYLDENENIHNDDEDDDALSFYDCEEGYISRNRSRSNSILSRKSPIRNKNFHYNYDYTANDQKQLLQPDQQQQNQQPMTVHDLAVTIVETAFVFIEFTFWQIYNFYNNDLRKLFDILPYEVFIRFLSSMLPGRHAALLIKPDFYGPLIALFLLPQSILLTLQTGHIGCSHFLLLCNAFIVSLSLWFTLSLLYRIIAYVLAPTIDFKQCLCFSGYSLFPWSIALLFTFIFEILELKSMTPMSWRIPTSLPLIVIGLPAAIAQG